jgi:WD40 repeat protein
MQTLKDYIDKIAAVAFSPNGQLLASAFSDGTIRLWDLETGAIVQTLKSHTVMITAVVFSPDSQLLVSASDNGTIRL